MNRARQHGARMAAAVLLVAALGMCGCGDERLFSELPAVSDDEISIEITRDPWVTYSDSGGKTTIVVQFIARGNGDLPLAAADVVVEMMIDDLPIDAESLLLEDSEELSSNLMYGLVLDASYSMLEHDPPAFDPMKEAARQSVEEGIAIWTGRPGEFRWDLCWFDELVNHRQGRWESSDLASIPEPGPGTATKLYAAVEFMASEMRQAYDGGAANGERDHHVMVVLSDGADNYSFFDNSAEPRQTLSTATTAEYARFGWEPTYLQDAVTAIESHPNLTVQVLGLGSSVNDDSLRAIASAGDGIYLKNPDTRAIDQLFARATLEFTTLQARGATVPLAPGDYSFRMVVWNLAKTAMAEHRFRMHAGDAEAGVID